MSDNPSNHNAWEVDPSDPSPTEAVERLVGLVNGYQGHASPVRLIQFGEPDADGNTITLTDADDPELNDPAYTLDLRNVGTGSRALRIRDKTNSVLLRVTEEGIELGASLVGSPVSIEDDLLVYGTLDVLGTSSLADLSVADTATFDSTVTVSDDLTVEATGTLVAEGNVEIDGDLAFTTQASNIFFPADTASPATTYLGDKIRLGTNAAGTKGYGLGTNTNELTLYSGGTLNGAGAAGLVVRQDTVGGSGYVVWHAGNDGAGSGLDADTLDGVQGANYLQVASANALYVQKSGDTMSGKLTIASGGLDVTGKVTAASGLDVTATGLAVTNSDLSVRGTLLKTASTGVGVNTTPNAAYKLDVSGATRLNGKVGINTDTDASLELNVSGDAKLSGRAGIGGNLTDGVALAVTGKGTISDDLTVRTNKLTVTSNGVGVNTTANSSYSLRVSGSADVTNDLQVQSALTAATENIGSGKFVVTANGVGVNTTAPSASYKLDVNGTTYLSDGFTAGYYTDATGSTTTLKVGSGSIGINTESPSASYTIDAFGTFRIATQRLPGSSQGDAAYRKLVRENTLKLRTEPYIKLSDQEIPAKVFVYTEQDDGQLNTFLEIRKTSLFVGTRAGYNNTFSTDYVLDVIGNTRIRASSGTDKITLLGDVESAGQITIKGTASAPKDLTLDNGDIMLTDGSVYVYQNDTGDGGYLNVDKDTSIGGKIDVTGIIRGFSYIRASNRIGFALHTTGQNTQSTWDGYVKAQRLSSGTWYNIKIPFLYDPNSNSTD